MNIDENSSEFNKQAPPRKRRGVAPKKDARRETAKALVPRKAPPRSATKLAYKKARSAYDNAKYRCGKAAGYESTRFLILSFHDMIAAIGLPRPEQSLDRVNPQGHYELGNIRWTNKYVQAANKRWGRSASVPSVQQLVEDARASLAGLEHQKLTAQLWHMTVARLARASVTPNVQQLTRELSMMPVPKDSFDAYDVPRADLPPGVFHLPALTSPAAWVRVRGGPFPPFASLSEGEMQTRKRRQRWAQRGIIGQFDQSEFRANFIQHELAQLLEDLKGAGACWLGCPSPQALLGGWFEGKMVAAAGRLTALSKHAAVLPACRAIEDFEDYHANQLERHVTAVHAEFLFIPDFQVDQGKGWSTDRSSLYSLMRLLKLRGDAKRKSFFGVQSPGKLPSTVRDYILGQFSVREFESQDQVSHPTANEIRASALATYKQWTGRNSFPRYYDLG